MDEKQKRLARNLAQAARFMIDAEWQWKEGNRVHCTRCGKEHLDTAKRKTHRKGCDYQALLLAVMFVATFNGATEEDILGPEHTTRNNPKAS